MRSDIDEIMQANNIDALLVTGPAQHNPVMVYLTGGGHVTNADLIKKRGEKGVLFHGVMERDEAAVVAERTGLVTRGYGTYPYDALLKEAGGDRTVAAALRYRDMLTDLGITSGRIALYGKVELRLAFPVLYELLRQMPGITLVGDTADVVMGSAMSTKDETEVERIRAMGKITTSVVGKVADYLSTRPVRGDVLIGPDDEPLTIGRVKSLINLWLAELGAENPEGTIFAIGRDAGVPHSTGGAQDVLRLGQTIVFDIFPCEQNGGYYYDFTRTWCLGYAPDDVQKLYDDVHAAFTTVLSELKVGRRFTEYQNIVCDLYESLGHPTILTTPDIEEGYIHSLGHGVGLRIHERPFSGSGALAEDVLKPGSIFTVEPGLYYPSRGMGVRLEDTLWVRPDGLFEILAPYPLDLVLPVKA